MSTAEGFKAEERAQRIAMIDEAAQPRLKKLAREYLGAQRGSRAQQNLLWSRLHEYWHQCSQAHARCIDAKAQPGVLTGALRALAQQLKWQQARHGPVDPAPARAILSISAAAPRPRPGG